jgi:hypothetical protein
VSGGASTGVVHVWSSNLMSNTSSEHFVKQADVTPSNGSYTLTLQPGRAYSLTTTTGQAKGNAGAPPAVRALALPYQENFDGYANNTLPKYTSDMQGAFEIKPCLNGRSGKCLQQVVPILPIYWQSPSDPFTLIGDTTWRDYTVSIDVNMQKTGQVKLIGRASKQNRPSTDQESYELIVSDTGAWSITKRDGEGVVTTLASGTTTAPGLRKWHTLSLTFAGSSITAKLNNTTLRTITDTTYHAGQVGFGEIGYLTNQYDNLRIHTGTG